jgi:flagellar hook-associated protein FlgK
MSGLPERNMVRKELVTKTQKIYEIINDLEISLETMRSRIASTLEDIRTIRRLIEDFPRE